MPTARYSFNTIVLIFLLGSMIFDVNNLKSQPQQE